MLSDLKKLPSYRELTFNFAAREIKAKYKQALLGVTWAMLQPLLQLLIMTLVFSYFARVPSEGYPYPLYLFCGLLPWLFFAGGINRGTGALVNQRSLITKIYFPRESLVLAALIAAMVDFFFASLVYVALLAFYGHAPDLHWLFAIPVFLVQLILVLGLMLILAPLNAIYRDIGQMVPLLLQLWMYLSPIMYPASLVPAHLQSLYFLNPMAGIIHSYRDALLRHQAPDPQVLGYSLAVGLTLLLVGYRFFKRIELRIADVA